MHALGLRASITVALASLATIVSLSIAPTIAHAVGTCNIFISLDYPLAPPDASNIPDDIVRIRFTLGTGTITDGTQATISQIHFDLDCDSGSPLVPGCPDEGAIMEYEGDDSITTTCGAIFGTGHPVGAYPNQLAFVASPPLIIPASTPEFCDIEFDVKVLAPGIDPTASRIEQVASFGDAQCNNGLMTGASISGWVPVCANCGGDDPCPASCSTTTTIATPTTTTTTLQGCAPSDRGALRCETAMAKSAAQLVKRIINCSATDARALVGVSPPVELSADGDACEAAARAKFDATVGRIVDKGGCPSSVLASAPSLGDNALAQTRANLGLVFVCPAP